jgi:PKD repeat protein
MKFRKSAILFLLALLVSGGCYKNEPVPDAAFNYSGSNNFTVPCIVQFSNQSVQAYSYDWWFGGDSTATTVGIPGSTAKDPTHLYAKAGVFSVTLRAYSESRKEWASIIKIISIKDTVRQEK